MNVLLSDTYSDYFKDIAINHPDLLHNDESGERTFFSINLEELYTKFHTIREKGNALYAIKYIWSINGNRIYYNAGFVIMGYAKPNDHEQVKETEKITERIAYQILDQIRSDSQNGNALFDNSLDELDGIQAEPYRYKADTNYRGWFVTFDFHRDFSCLNFEE